MIGQGIICDNVKGGRVNMETFITRAEHEEFRRSMEFANQNLADEDKRQNRRLDILEENAKQNTALVANVERLAVNMENMLKAQEAQGKRLETLESRDGEMWRKVVAYAVTAVVGIVIGYISTRFGL